MSAHRPTRGTAVAAAAVAVLVTGIIRRRVELWRGSGRRGHGTRARRGGKGARARRKKRRRANARQGGGGKGGNGSGGGNVTLFVTGLPRAIRGKSIMWTLRDVFKPYGASRVRVGRNSDNHTRGWAHVSVARAKADEAIAAVNGRLGLVMGINEHNRRDTCTVVEVEAGTQGKSDGGELDGSDTAHSGTDAATPKPYVLLVTRVVGKVDVLFPDFTREQRLALRMDPVAMFSVTDQYSADRISEFVRAIIEVGAQRQATVEEPCTRRLAVTDATACVGGNTLSFARYFDHVDSFEIDPERYAELQHNVHTVAGFPRDRVCVTLGDFLASAVAASARGAAEASTSVRAAYTDLVWMDPPWGGPRYATLPSIPDLFLGGHARVFDGAFTADSGAGSDEAGVSVTTLCERLSRSGICGVVAMRVPFNFAVDDWAARMVALHGDELKAERVFPFKLKFDKAFLLIVVTNTVSFPPMVAADEEGSAPPLQFRTADLDAVIEAINRVNRKWGKEHHPAFYDYDVNRWISISRWHGTGLSRWAAPTP